MILALVLLLSSATAAPKVDPKTGRIRLLMIGETGPTNQEATYFLFTDPMVDLSIVPAGDVADVETSKRFVRIYVPRTYERLASDYDVLELFDFVPYILMDKHIQWMHDAVRDSGLGLALVEMGWYSVTDWTGNDAEAWMATPLYLAYPCDLVIGKGNKITPFMDIVDEDPLVDLPGFEKVQMTGVNTHGIQIARPGSRLFTRWRAGKEDAIVGGSYGQASTIMIPMGWDNVPTETAQGWDYYVDLVLNHVYYVARVPLPEDPDLARQIRLGFNEFHTRESIALSILEFIDRFGASTGRLEQRIIQLTSQKTLAQDLYVQGDYQGSWETLNLAIQGFSEISQDSMKLKERAFLWIYLVEWLAVTGTFLACGFILWSLMVRRRLYREVSLTRTR